MPVRTRRAQQAPFHATLATFSSEYDNSSAVAMAAVNGRFGNGTAGFNSLPIDIHSAVFLPDAAGFEAEQAKPPVDAMKTDDKTGEEDGTVCRVTVALPSPGSEPVKRRRAVGVLGGISPQTPDDRIAQLNMHTARVPAPSPFIPRLQKLGVESVQLILGPQILEQRVMKERGMNVSGLREACRLPHRTRDCPLPGTAADPDYKMWESALSAQLQRIDSLGVNRSGIVYDIWNEPNFVTAPGNGGGGWPYPSKYYTPPQGALPYQHFWEVWNRAVRLIRRLQPDATIVGPSIAPGPGSTANAGIDPEHATKAQWLASRWSPQKAWLLEFLSQAHANSTMPGLISWVK